MKTRAVIVTLVVLGGVLVYVINAVLMTVFAGDGLFVERLVLGVTPHQWLARAAGLAVLLIIALILARLVREGPVPTRPVTEEAPTEALRPEDLLREAEVMILGMDADGRITFFNRRCAEVLGHDPASVVGQSFLDVLIPPRGLPTILPIFTAVVQRGEEAALESAWLTEGGREVIIAAQFSPVRDARGEVIGAVAVCSEVTEYRLTEQELLLSREPWRPLAETVYGDGFAALDLSGRISWASASLAQMLGTTPEALFGADFREWARERARAEIDRGLQECVQLRQRVELDINLTAEDGRLLPADIVLVPLEHSEEVVGVFAVVRDLTELKRAVIELAAADDETRAEFETLARQLRDTEERVRQAQSELRAEADAEIERLRVELRQADDRVAAARQAALAEREAEVAELRARLAEAQERLATAEADARADAEAEVAELRGRLLTSQRLIQEAREQALAEREEEVTTLWAQLAAAEEQAASSADAAVARYQAEVEALQAQLASAEERTQEAVAAARAEARAEIERLTERALEAERAVEAAREAALAEGQAEVEALQAELASAEERVQEAVAAARAEAQAEIERLTARALEAERAVEAAREAAITERQAEVEALQAELAAAEERAQEAEAAARAEIERLTARALEAERAVEAAREAALAERQAEVEALQAQLAAAEERTQEAVAAARAEARAEIERLTERALEAERAVEAAREAALAERQAEIEGLQAELASAEERAQEAVAAARAEAEGRIEGLQAQLKNVAERIEQARQRERKLAREDYEAEVARMVKEVEDARRLAREAQEEARSRRQFADEKLAAELEEARREAEAAAKAAQAELAAQLAHFSARIAELQRQAEAAQEAARAEYEERAGRLSAQLDEARERLRRAQAEVREQYQAMFDSMSALVVVHDAGGRILFANASAARVAGVGSEELVGRDCAEVWGRCGAQFDRCPGQQALAHGRAPALELVGEDDRTLRLQAAPVRTPGGEEIGALEMAVDVTEIRQALSAAEARVNALQQLMDTIPHPVFTTDAYGRYRACNAAFAELLGVAPDEVLGHSLTELEEHIAPEVIEVLVRTDTELLHTGGVESYEAAIRGADGRLRTWAFRKVALARASGRPTGIMCAMMDISGLHAAQAALEEERQRTATVLQRVPAIIAEVAPDGTTQAVYGEVAAILGYRPEDLVGRDWWDTLFPGQLRDQLREFLGGLHAGADLTDRALTVRRADGEERTLSWTTANVHDPQRGLQSIFAVAYDIHERAEAESVLQARFNDTYDRVKKLECLNNVLRVLSDRGLSLTEIMSGIVASLPPALIHPAVATAEICVWQHTRRAGESSRPPVARLSAGIVVNGETVGSLEVRYHEERPELFEGPFSGAERDLVNVIARRLGETIEQRSTEDSLAKLHEYRERLIEQSNCWIMALDRNRNVVLWNRTAEQISGYGRDEATAGDQIWERLFPDPTYRTEMTRAIMEVIFGARALEDWETTIRDASGARKVIAWHARRLIDDEGTTTGVVAIGREVKGKSEG